MLYLVVVLVLVVKVLLLNSRNDVYFSKLQSKAVGLPYVSSLIFLKRNGLLI